MLSATTRRVEANTSPLLNQRFEKRFRKEVSNYIGADRQAIDQRLRELDREWNTERLIEVEAPTMIGLGIALGLTHDKRWFAASAFAAGMVILHSLQGWYPLLPIFRRLGVRSQNEIERERIALKALRGDHQEKNAKAIG